MIRVKLDHQNYILVKILIKWIEVYNYLREVKLDIRLYRIIRII